MDILCLPHCGPYDIVSTKFIHLQPLTFMAIQNIKLLTASCKKLTGHFSMTEVDIPILLRRCGVPTSLVKSYVLYHVLELWRHVLYTAMHQSWYEMA